MPLNPSFASTHRALIVLNMHGANLLAQMRYAEARDTLADAILVAKAAEQISRAPSAEMAASTAIWIDAKAQAALLRTLSTAPENLVNSSVEIQMKILTFSSFGASNITAPTFHPSQVYVVNMDPEENDLDADEDSLNLVSCVVLMNMALAYLGLSQLPGNRGNNLEAKAVHLFKLSQSLVRRLSSDFVEQGETDTEVLSGFLQIESISLHGLILVLRVLGRDGEAHGCYHRLHMLQTAIGELAEEDRRLYRKFESAAPAA